MSAAKYTPGPLRAVPSKTTGDYAVRSADGNIVAEFFEAIRRHDERAAEEAKANAELFAAAPELLEALVAAESILRYAPDISTNCGGIQPFTSTASALKLVRAAIAKATRTADAELLRQCADQMSAAQYVAHHSV